VAVLRPAPTPARLSAEFAQALSSRRATPLPPRIGALLGIEHEFQVTLLGRPVDFRHVIHRLPIDGLRIDPRDPNAYRCTWGGMIRADGAEAEIATPPVVVGADLAARAVAAAIRGRSELVRALPPEAALEGYSTHLSVSVPDSLVDAAASIFVRRFSAAMTLLLDAPTSPGLLVRPRSGRLELGGEYAEGVRLAAASVFAVGAVRAAADAAGRRFTIGRGLPAELAVTPAPAVERYGWFVGDAELGAALHPDGPLAVLRLAGGGTIRGGAHLLAAWRSARRHLPDVDAASLAATDATVAAIAAGGTADLTLEVSAANMGAADGGVWAGALATRARPGFAVDPVLLSWDVAVFRITGGRREAYACLPRDVLGGALAALDAGSLDHLLRGYLFAGTAGRVLSSSAQTRAAGLYRGIGKAADLAGVERGPEGGGGKRQRDRRDDRSDRTQQSQAPQSPASAPAAGTVAAAARLTARTAAGAAGGREIFGLPVALVGGVAAVAIVGTIVGALLIGGSAGAGPTPAPVAPGSSPGATAVAPSDPASAGNAICDPWLSPEVVAGLTGPTVLSVDGSIYPTEGVPGAWVLSCIWRLGDGSNLFFEVFEQDFFSGPEQGLGPTEVALPSLGAGAAIDAQSGLVRWFPDATYGYRMYSWSSDGVTPLPADVVEKLALSVVPSEIPPAPVPSAP
jgi:hypothetical protein